MKMKLKFLTGKAASALLVTLFLMTILAISIAGYLTYVQQQSNLGARSQTWNMTMAVAEAGIEEALEALNASPSGTFSSADGWTQSGNIYTLHRTLLAGEYWVTNDFSDPTQPTLTSRAFLNSAWFTARQPSYFFASGGISGTRPTRAVQVTTAKGNLILAAMVAKHTIDMNGNNGLTDSFDSGDPTKSSNGLYDPAKRQQHGDVASNEGIANAVDTGNFDIYGNVSTGPNGTVKIGSNGGVSGTVSHDANFTFPNTTAPYSSGLCAPAGDILTVAGTTTNITAVVTNSTTPPPPAGSGQTIITTTNFTYASSSLYPSGYTVTKTNSSSYISSTNKSIVMTGSNLVCSSTSYAANTLPPNVCSYTLQSTSTNSASYKNITTIAGTNVTYATNLTFVYSTNYTYTYIQPTYSYTIYTGTIYYTTNHYDHVICGDSYCPDGLSGSTYISCPSRLVLPNGMDLSGGNTITVGESGSVSVYAGGDKLTISGNAVVNKTGYAANFIVYGADTVNELDFSVSGNGSFTGVVVAPNASATMNGGGSSDTNDFNGSIMADTIKMNGHFQFHYDEALSRIGKNGRFLITSWKEVP